MSAAGRTLFGIPVRESEHIGRDIIFHLQPQHVVIMHPLMRIELTHRGDPVGRSEAVARYLAERAERELDAVLARVDSLVAIARTFDVPFGTLQRDGDWTTWTMSGLVANDHVIEECWGGAR